MESIELLIFSLVMSLDRITPLLVQLLVALVPVLALGVAGYAVHIVARRDRGGRE